MIGNIRNTFIRRAVLIAALVVLYPAALVVTALIGITQEMGELHDAVSSAWKGR